VSEGLSLFGLLFLLDGAAVELVLFGGGLEATVSHLAGGIDELELDLFGGGSGGVGEDGLSEDEDLLLGADAATLDDDEVVFDDTIVGEASHGGDLLVGQISFGGGVVQGVTGGHSVDLLVHLCSVVITVLTGSGHAEHNSGGMPGSDTSDLSVTSVGLLLQMLDTESLDDTLHSVTLGDSDDV